MSQDFSWPQLDTWQLRDLLHEAAGEKNLIGKNSKILFLPSSLSYICRMRIYTLFVFFLLVYFIACNKVSAQQYQPVSTFNDMEAGVTVMVRDPSFQYLIAGDSNGNLYFRNLITGVLIKKIKVHGAPVTQLQFNSNGQLLISATADGEIKIFDFKKDKVIQSIYSPGYSGINFVLFSIADGFVYFNGKGTLYKTRSA